MYMYMCMSCCTCCCKIPPWVAFAESAMGRYLLGLFLAAAVASSSAVGLNAGALVAPAAARRTPAPLALVLPQDSVAESAFRQPYLETGSS
jgi:hypothetical protein